MKVGFALLGLGVVSLTIHWTLSAHHCDGVLWSSPEQSTAPTGLILGSSGCLCCEALHTTTFKSLRKHSLRHSLPHRITTTAFGVLFLVCRVRSSGLGQPSTYGPSQPTADAVH